jgi:hypothetical protein
MNGFEVLGDDFLGRDRDPVVFFEKAHQLENPRRIDDAGAHSAKAREF